MSTIDALTSSLPLAAARPTVADRFWRGTLLTVLLVGLDLLGFTAIWLGSWALRRGYDPVFPNPINELHFYLRALLVVVPLWIAVSAFHGLYAHREKVSSLAQTRALLIAAKDGLIGSFALAYLLRNYSLGRSVVCLSALLNFVWLYTSRTVLREMKRRALERGIGLRRAIIVGGGTLAQRVVDRIARHAEIGYALVGYVGPPTNGTGPLSIPLNARVGMASRAAGGQGNGGNGAIGSTALTRLGGFEDLPGLIRSLGVEEVFVATPELPNSETLNLIARCEGSGAHFNLCSNILEVITDRVKIDDIGDLPVIPFRGTVPPPMQAFAKRVLDLVVSVGLLLVFAIPMLVIAVLILLTTGRPVLFRQQRIGQGGRPFEIVKFRTMTPDTPAYSAAPTESNDPRITWIGRFLRKTSLDELPQLLNVLRGDMSMVGPRPEMPFIVEKYEEWQRRRLDVKPGITGLWQIVGRKNLPLTLNLEYDFYYIKNQSLMLDVVILLRTVPAVVFGRGAF